MKLKKILFSIPFLFIPYVVRADAMLNNAIKGTVLEEKDNLPSIVGTFIKSVIGMLGIVLVILILYGGFTWMTAAGDSKKVDKGKDIIKAAVIGLIITLSAYIITYYVVKNITNITKS